MTTYQLLETLTEDAKEYRKTAMESIRGVKQCVDYGLYTCDLEERK